MIALVCGGRDYSDRETLFRVLDRLKPTKIIHGGARGADQLSGDWAMHNYVRIRVFPADWETYGKRAGPIRNQQMLDEGNPDIVVAFPGGNGTRDMVRRAASRGLPLIVFDTILQAKTLSHGNFLPRQYDLFWGQR